MQNNKIRRVSDDELNLQQDYSQKARDILTERYGTPHAIVRTFGCQQNVADSQRLQGMLVAMGYEMTEDESCADLILFNTCAVREHAEDRVMGNIGALKAYKTRRPDAILAVCGCMMQQPHVAERIKQHYPYVDLLFGTHVIHRLPEFVFDCISGRRKIFEAPDIDGVIAEGIPVKYDNTLRGWLPIMYGCNNFCSYCVVPHVRGRERSRSINDILPDFINMVQSGIRDITLLGQNVNSYCGDDGLSFPQLLYRLNEVEGDFTIRFMSSHPKDCTHELLDAMAHCDKVERHLHLPVQSGNNRVLKAMNRHYDREKYLSLVDYARSIMPDLMLTSDIIVGFPGESYEEFCDTISLIKQVRYHSLYTFIYSPRVGTPAALMEDNVSREQKGEWFKQLCDEQERISSEIVRQQWGKNFRVLCEEQSKKNGWLLGRTRCNQMVEFESDSSLIGSFAEVKINPSENWILQGKLI